LDYRYRGSYDYFLVVNPIKLQRSDLIKTVLILFCFSFLTWQRVAYSAIRVVDSRGTLIQLARPAKRVISLSPNLSEILFAIDAGDIIIARDKYSDYPPAIARVPIISRYFQLNLESVLLLKPDLIVAEQASFLSGKLNRLREMGIPVYINKAENLRSIVKTIFDLGQLTGHELKAVSMGQEFIQRIESIREKFQAKESVTVFFELWSKPLLTVNQHTIIHEMITLCGGKNIFADLLTTSPQVSVESLLVKNPEAILSSKINFASRWQSYSSLKAVKNDHLFYISADMIERTGPRLLQGLTQICEALESVRR
jgi:iron complex transport system substrate-binding protein